MNKTNLAIIKPMILLFIILNGFFILGRSTLAKWNADQDVLIAGNLLLFVTILVSFLLLKNALGSSNPQAFVRAMYGSFIIKFFVLAIAAFIYIMLTKKNVNRPALFTCIGLYFLYTFIEISVLMKLLKQKKNA